MVHDVNEAPVGVVASWLVPEHAHPGATIANVSARDQTSTTIATVHLLSVLWVRVALRLSAPSSVQHPNSTSLRLLYDPPRAGSAGLNYESAQQYQIIFSVSDQAGLGEQFSCLLRVKDQNDAPYLSFESTTFSTPENVGPGSEIGSVIVRDDDPGDSISLYISAQDAGAGINFALVSLANPRQWSLVLRAGSSTLKHRRITQFK